MKKYLVVAWDDECPAIHLGNIKADYNSVEECREFIHNHLTYPDGMFFGHVEIINQDTFEEVWNQTMYKPEEEKGKPYAHN